MTERTIPQTNKPAPTREERLAQRLRENLRLRKAQARALDAEAEADKDEPSAQT